ncbi:MAG: SCP2 sterol-binding domain-containing protein [Pseudomonadota bacterium]
MQLPLPATHAIETAFNALLQLDNKASARLPKMQGKIVDLHIIGFDLHVYFLVHPERVEVLRYFDGTVDASISGTPLSIASMGLSNRAMFEGDVSIDGDVETGNQFKRLLDTLDIDWEEQLSHFSGDIVAHQLGNIVRRSAQWADRTAGAMREDLGDYLREEALLTPTPDECEIFYTSVDKLRSDLDRLEARIAQLHQTLSTDKSA